MTASFKYQGPERFQRWMASDGQKYEEGPEEVGVISRVLGQEGDNTRTSRTFYKEVIQETILFGSETWVMTPRIRRSLGGLHNRVYHFIAEMKPRRDTTGRQEYPTLEAEMVELGLKEVYTYVLCHQNNTAQYIVTRPIPELCLEEERRPGTRVEWMQCEKEGIEMEGATAVARAV